MENRFKNIDHLKQFFNSVLNSMTEGVVVIDVQERIVLFNYGAENLSGYDRESAVGCLYKELLGQHLSERFTPIYTLKCGECQLHQEKEIWNKSGQQIPVRFSTSPIHDPAGRLIGVVEVMTDLTRLKQLESVKQQIKTQASLEQMAGLIANEIRNPLGGILGNVDVMKQSYLKNREYQDRLQAIKTSINQINSVVSRFQWFAKSVSPNYQSIDLIQYLQDVLAVFMKNNPVDAHKITFDFTYPKSLRTLMWSIDPVLMEQALLDILDNGLKALSGRGSISIHLANHLKNDSIEISISDTGKGMSKQVLERLFTPFFTTRSRGMGLSLAVARYFIDLHRGDIRVESHVGKGSIFKIRLPK